MGPIQMATFRPAFPQLPAGAFVDKRIPTISLQPNLLNAVVIARQMQIGAQGAMAGGAIAPGRPAAAQLSIEDLLDLERELYVDPSMSLQRHFRLYLCPGVVAGGVLTFTPQRRCVPIRMVIASGTAGTITNLQAGVEQYFAQNSAVPAAVYSELAQQTGWLRPVIVEVGNTITATTTLAANTPVGLFCFDLSEKGLLAPPLGKPRTIGFSQSIGAASSATILLNPQKDFRIRRLAFDESVTNYSSLTVTGLTVANDPQTESTGVLPVQMFSTKALSAMIDGDLCKVGAQIAITVANSNAGAVTAQGEVWGDTAD
jgi:hypothetical protein